VLEAIQQTREAGMRAAKRPSAAIKPAQVLPWADGDLVKFYQRHRRGRLSAGWHHGRVQAIADRETTVRLSWGHSVTVPHDEIVPVGTK
jgi:hypothetical protein